MTTRKTASKQSKKAKINFDVDPKTRKKVDKEIKHTPLKTLFILVLVLLMGLGVGAVPAYFLMRNDCFELIGADEITRFVGESYADEGAKIIAFNKDDSKKVKTESNMQVDQNGNFTSSEVGTYYIIYIVDNLKYGKIFKIKKIRLVTFVEPSDDVVVDD